MAIEKLNICKECFYSQRMDEKNEKSPLVCLRYPPTVVLVPQKQALTGEITGLPISAFPHVNDGWSCGEWDDQGPETGSTLHVLN